jgi:putative endonuclease
MSAQESKHNHDPQLGQQSFDISLEHLFASEDYYVFLVANDTRDQVQSGLAGSLKVLVDQWQRADEGDATPLMQPGQCRHLVYWECFSDLDLALLREKELQGLSFKKKQTLVNRTNPEWHSLNGVV